MNINQVVEFLRTELDGVKFDDLITKLSEVKHEDIGHIECRQIDKDVIDVDIDTGATRVNGKYTESMLWTVTLRRIVNWYPIPNTYITINKDVLMADDVEVFPYGLSLVQSDVIQNSDGEYALNIPVCMNDLDYKAVNNAFEGRYVPAELCESVIDVIPDGETKLAVLHTIKEFYDYGYDKE